MVINPSLLPPPPHDPWAPNYLATIKAAAQAGRTQAPRLLWLTLFPPGGQHLETCLGKGPSKGCVNHCENWCLGS